MKIKKKKINIDEVFSINHADGREQVLYYADSLYPDEYSLEEMRYYIKGEQDAIYNGDSHPGGICLRYGSGAAKNACSFYSAFHTGPGMDYQVLY